MNILIIEDEEATARKLQRLLVQVAPTATLAGQLGSVEESVAWLRTNPMPELILMDIELADGQSFEIFNQVAVTCPVIFTTAYDEYALKAFKVNSIDYLLKPVREADLRAALAKLQALKQSLAGPDSGWQDSLIGLLRQLNPERAAESGPATAKPGAPATEARAERTRFLVKQGQRMFSISIEANNLLLHPFQNYFPESQRRPGLDDRLYHGRVGKHAEPAAIFPAQPADYRRAPVR